MELMTGTKIITSFKKGTFASPTSLLEYFTYFSVNLKSHALASENHHLSTQF